MADNTFTDRLRRLFSTQVIVRRVGKGRLKVVDTENLQRAARDSGTTRSNSRSVYASNNYKQKPFYSKSANHDSHRLSLFMDYETMDQDPILSSALDIYADESTVRDETRTLVSIKSSNEEIKKILYNLLYDILNIDHNLWSWVRNLCKYGDFFLALDVQESIGITGVIPVSPQNVVRVEGEDPENPELVKFQMVEPTTTNNMRMETHSPSVLENYEMAHFRLLSDTNFLPYGRSMLEAGRKIFKMLTLMEDAMLIHRIMRAPERRIFKVDTGNIPPSEVDQHMQNIINGMRKIPHVDPATGEYNLRFNLQNMTEDYFLPVRGSESGTDISTLAGMSNEGYIEDVEYVRNRMMASLKIPKAFLGYDEGVAGKATLAAEDIRFARTIERIQNVVIGELTKIAIVHLYSQGYTDSDLVDFELTLTSPSIIYERQKIELLSEKVDLVSNLKELNLHSNKWIYENIFNLSADEWNTEQDLVVQDQKTKFRLNQIESEGNDPSTTGQSYGTPHDIASMHTATKADLVDQVASKNAEETRGRPKKLSKINTNRDTINGRNPLGDADLDKANIPDSDPQGNLSDKGSLSNESANSALADLLRSSTLGKMEAVRKTLLAEDKKVDKDVSFIKDSLIEE